MRGLHLPVDDFHAPTTQQMLEALAFLDEARATSTPVAVHCLAGQGRTGTVLAAYLIRGGLSAEQAIAEVRAICPGAIEASPQTAALEAWARIAPGSSETIESPHDARAHDGRERWTPYDGAFWERDESPARSLPRWATCQTPSWPRSVHDRPTTAAAFATCHGASRAHADYEALAADPEIDIVYIATPHALHHANARLCLEHGKAVLCEKPFTINAAQARDLIRLAQERQLFLMEAMWTRCLPALTELRRQSSRTGSSARFAS